MNVLLWLLRNVVVLLMNKRIIPLLTICLLLGGCQNNTATNESIEIVVVDKTPPKITVKQKTIEITEGDKLDISKNYSVSDNSDDAVTVETEDSKLDTKKAGTYKITITATDKAGNETKDSFTVVVKEKPKPTPTPTPEVKKETPSTNQSNPKTDTNTAQNQQVQQQSPPVDNNTATESQSATQSNQSTDTTTSDGEENWQTSGPYDSMQACQMAARDKGAIEWDCKSNNGQITLIWR